MLLIPAIDIIDGKCVRLTQGDYSQVKRYAVDPVAIAKEMTSKGISTLHVIDLDGARLGYPANQQLIKQISRETKIKLQVGGGIRTYYDAADYLDSGIEKIIFGTSVIENLSLIEKVIQCYGSQRVLISLDIKEGLLAVKGWSKTCRVPIPELMISLKTIGVTNLIITDVKSDGTLLGPDLTTIQKFLTQDFLIYLAGGVGQLSDIYKLSDRNLAGVVIGKAIYEGRVTLDQIAAFSGYRNELTKRIIPCLDIQDGCVVKGIFFKNLKRVGDPITLAKYYRDQGADELTFLDITATLEARKQSLKLANAVAMNLDIPFTIGGGVSCLEDIKHFLAAGADKVLIGSAAVKNPTLIAEASKRFGSQCIVISLDVKRQENYWEIIIHSGTQATGIDAIVFAKQMESLGAGELLVNSLDRDGTKTGYDIALLQAITNAVQLPVIASSGAGRKQDFLDAFQKTSVDAVLAAGLFHSQELAIPDLKQFLSDNQVRVR